MFSICINGIFCLLIFLTDPGFNLLMNLLCKKKEKEKKKQKRIILKNMMNEIKIEKRNEQKQK